MKPLIVSTVYNVPSSWHKKYRCLVVRETGCNTREGYVVHSYWGLGGRHCLIVFVTRDVDISETDINENNAMWVTVDVTKRRTTYSRKCRYISKTREDEGLRTQMYGSGVRGWGSSDPTCRLSWHTTSRTEPELCFKRPNLVTSSNDGKRYRPQPRTPLP